MLGLLPAHAWDMLWKDARTVGWVLVWPAHRLQSPPHHVPILVSALRSPEAWEKPTASFFYPSLGYPKDLPRYELQGTQLTGPLNAGTT